MRWSAAFNDFYTQNSSYFAFIFECYPQIKLLFVNNTALINNENALRVLYYCAHSMMSDEQNTLDLNALLDLLHTALSDLDILKHSRELFEQLEEFNSLSCDTINRLLSPAFRLFFTDFCELFLKLSDINFIRPDNARMILAVLLDQFACAAKLLTILKACYKTDIYVEMPHHYWQLIFQLLQKNERALIELAIIFEKLMDLNALTEAQIDFHFSELQKLLPEADFESIHQYFVEQMRKIEQEKFSLLGLTEAQKLTMLRYAREVDLVRGTGFPLGKLARCSDFYEKIFPYINADTAYILKCFFDKVPQYDYLMILLNAMNFLQTIASKLPRENDQLIDQNVRQLVSCFMMCFEAQKMVPKNIITFFEKYLASLNRPANLDVSRERFFNRVIASSESHGPVFSHLSPK